MSKQAKFLFLGTGGSMGVPMVGCKCSVCLSSDPRNKRRRSAGLLQVEGKKILIDAGPDVREQLLDADVKMLDAAILTHAHYDHFAGIDDLKAFYFHQKRRVPCFLSKETFDEVKVRYHYLLQKEQGRDENGIHMDFRILADDFGKMEVEGTFIEYMSYFQLGMKVTGVRYRNFAYVSDIKNYSPELIDRLHGIDILVLSALRETKSPMHFSIEEAIAFAREVKAKKTFFTHLAHDVDFDKTSAGLPSDIRLCYDGLEISLDS